MNNRRLHLVCVIAVLCCSSFTAAQEKLPAVKSCPDLANIKIENTKILSAELIAANTPLQMRGFPAPMTFKSLPAHCRVQGIVNPHKGKDGKDYGDTFELRMPTDWSGRLLYQGGGGLDGILNPAIGLEMSSTGEPTSALSPNSPSGMGVP